MVNYMAVGNVPAEEVFGSKDNLKFLLHGMNCTKKICLIIAAMEKVARGVDWRWNVNFPGALVTRVSVLVIDRLKENFDISLPDLTKHVLQQVYEENKLKEGLEDEEHGEEGDEGADGV